MRALVHDYLNKRLSRRAFMARVAHTGFSTAAAAAIVEALTPLVTAEALAAERGRAGTTIAEGTGGSLLVEQLRAAGVRFFFNCTSSATYPVLDAVLDRPDVQLVQCLHEAQMVAIAQGYTLATGNVAFTLNDSSGFPNTLANMFNASRDQTPIVIGSQREQRAVQGGRDAYEEWDDFLGPSASFARWRWNVDAAERIPEITRRAFTIATTPPAGPVALAFPEDVLAAKGVRAAIVPRERFILAPKMVPDAGLVEQAARLVLEARNPVVLVGPEVTRANAAAAVMAFADRLALPVAQGESLFADAPTDHPLFVGEWGEPPHYPPDVDLVLNLGAPMPSLPGMMPSDVRIVHASIDADRIGRIVPTDVGIVADVRETATDLLTALESLATSSRIDAIADGRREAIHGHTAMTRAGQRRAAEALWNAVPLSWERVAGELDRRLAPDAIVVSELSQKRWDAGWTWAADRASGVLASNGLDYAPLAFKQNQALSQFTFAPGGKRRIGKSTGGALGWSVGVGIGVKLGAPDTQVVTLVGDGGFLFGQAEALWTMARYEVPVLVVVFDNRSYNGPRNQIMIESERQRATGKDMSCYLGDPDVDFAKIAAAFGIAGEVVRAPAEVGPALDRAFAAIRDGKPYLIDAVVARTGAAADSTWHPKFSVAGIRTRKV